MVAKTIQRSFDLNALEEVLSLYPDIVLDFDAEEWLFNYRNIALKEGDNFGLFQYEYPGMFGGHYFFKNARGKEAIQLAVKMLDYIFSVENAQVIRGLTPIDNKAAKLISRKIGFQSLGTIDTPDGKCEVFYLHKKDFNRKWGF